MKKLLLILLPLFMVMSCDVAGDDDKDDSPAYVGTWTTSIDAVFVKVDITSVFTESTFENTEVTTSPLTPGVTSTQKRKGTFTVDGNSVTMITTHITNEEGEYIDFKSKLDYKEGDETNSGTWAIDGNTLTFTGKDDEGNDEVIVYTKA